MNFQVPQFIEIEDKVIGPLSFKQFIYVAGAAGLSFICYAFLPLYLALLPIAGLMTLGLALAFYQVNNRPFIITLQSALRYFTSHKLYLWQQRTNSNLSISPQNSKPGEDGSLEAPRLSKSKLSDLSWNLDIKETIQ